MKDNEFIKKIKKEYEKKKVNDIQEELTRYILYYWYKDTNDSRIKYMKPPIEPLYKERPKLNKWENVCYYLSYIKYNLILIDINKITKKELTKYNIKELKEISIENNINIENKNKEELIILLLELKNKDLKEECQYCESDDENCDDCNKHLNKIIKIEEIKDENMENYKEEDLNKLKVKELYEICEKKGFYTNLKRLKKKEYINSIVNNKPLRQKKIKQSKEEKERNKDIKTLIKLQRKYGRDWILDFLEPEF